MDFGEGHPSLKVTTPQVAPLRLQTTSCRSGVRRVPPIKKPRFSRATSSWCRAVTSSRLRACSTERAWTTHRHREHLRKHAARNPGGVTTEIDTDQCLIDHTRPGRGQPQATQARVDDLEQRGLVSSQGLQRYAPSSSARRSPVEGRAPRGGATGDRTNPDGSDVAHSLRLLNSVTSLFSTRIRAWLTSQAGTMPLSGTAGQSVRTGDLLVTRRCEGPDGGRETRIHAGQEGRLGAACRNRTDDLLLRMNRPGSTRLHRSPLNCGYALKERHYGGPNAVATAIELHRKNAPRTVPLEPGGERLTLVSAPFGGSTCT